MAKKGRNSGVRKRIFTTAGGDDVYKSQKHKGSPYHTQDKKTGQIKSKAKKPTEDRLKPATKAKPNPKGKPPVKPTVQAAPTTTSKRVPAKKGGTKVAKTTPNKVPKDMGKASVVPKKGLPKPSSVASKALVGNPFVAMAVSAGLSSVERQSKLLGLDKPQAPKQPKKTRLAVPPKKSLLTDSQELATRPSVLPKVKVTAPQPKQKAPVKPKAPIKPAKPVQKKPTRLKAGGDSWAWTGTGTQSVPKGKSSPKPKPKKSSGGLGNSTWLLNASWDDIN